MPNDRRGILFSQPMIEALVDGRKTQTRRLASSPLRHARPGDHLWVRETHAYVGTTDPGWLVYLQSYEADCRLHGFDEPFPDRRSVIWTPSLLMRRTASRLTLFVEDVRFERLHQISPLDCRAEGINRYQFHPSDDHPLCDGYTHIWPDDKKSVLHPTGKEAYEALWRSLHPETRPVRDPATKRITGHEPNPARWEANPELVAITFALAHRNIDQAPPL